MVPKRQVESHQAHSIVGTSGSFYGRTQTAASGQQHSQFDLQQALNLLQRDFVGRNLLVSTHPHAITDHYQSDPSYSLQHHQRYLHELAVQSSIAQKKREVELLNVATILTSRAVPPAIAGLAVQPHPAHTLRPGMASLMAPTQSNQTDENAVEEQESQEDEFLHNEEDPSMDSFPFKLYRLMTQVEKQGRTDIISFMPDGITFKVHKQAAFVEDIMPYFFNSSRLSSFHRQLNMYSFRRVTEGCFRGGFRNKNFVKGKPLLCKNIKRRKNLAAKKPPPPSEETTRPPLPKNKPSRPTKNMV